MNIDFDKIVKGIKRESKKLKKGIPSLINNFSDEIYELKRLQKTIEKQAKKISQATVVALAESILKKQGYEVSVEEKEVVAKKGNSKVLVAVLADSDKWAERMNTLNCTKGLVFAVEPLSEEKEKVWSKMNTDVLTGKSLVDYLVS